MKFTTSAILSVFFLLVISTGIGTAIADPSAMGGMGMMMAPQLPFDFGANGYSGKLSFESDIILTSPDQIEPFSMKMAVKPKKTRFEGTQEGKPFVMIINAEKDAFYVFSADSGEWVKFKVSSMKSMAASAAHQTPGVKSLQFVPGKGYAKTGVEVVDGKKCTIWTFKNDAGEQGKVWMWTDNNLLIQAQSQSDKGVSTLLFKGLTIKPLADSLFEPPAGAKVTDMDEMMKLMNAAQQKVNPFQGREMPSPNGFPSPAGY